LGEPGAAVTPVRRVVFLDRDGVVTVPREASGKGYAVRSTSELQFYDDAAESVLRLRTAGFDVVIVTNQPDVSAGLITLEVLDDIHDVVATHLKVDKIRTCTHLAVDACQCRKPLPGLLIEESLEKSLSFSSSWMVGDRDSDIEAGRSAGCRTIFIDRGWVGETGDEADVAVADLAHAVDAIVFHMTSSRGGGSL
jgi:D-glycero-D-manno-heptose 1,7-bisphosphate phosphatase